MSEFAVKWIYVLDKDFSYNIAPYLPQEFSAGCAFEDRTGKRRLEIHPDGTMKVLADYAWDGCTPKFALWDILLGIPDGVPNFQTKKPITLRYCTMCYISFLMRICPFHVRAPIKFSMNCSREIISGRVTFTMRLFVSLAEFSD